MNMKTTTIHAVKYKVAPSDLLDHYFETCRAQAHQFSTWLKEAHESSDKPLLRLLTYFRSEPVQVVVGNFRSFLARDTHPWDRSLSSADSKKTVQRKIAKSIAEDFRSQGMFPLPLFANKPLPLVAQVMCTSLSHYQSWYSCNEETRANYSKAEGQLADKKGRLDACTMKRFQKWLNHCEGKNYFKLSARVVSRFRSGKTTGYYNPDALASLLSLFPDWDRSAADTILLDKYAEVELTKRWVERLKTSAAWSPPGQDVGKMTLLFMNTLPGYRVRFTHDAVANQSIPHFDIQLHGQWTPLRTLRNDKGAANSMIVVKECKNVCNTKYRLTFQRYGKTHTGYCNSAILSKKNGEYFVQMGLCFPNQPATGHLNGLVEGKGKQDKGLMVGDYHSIEEVLRYFNSSPVTVKKIPVDINNFKVMGVDLGIKRPASCAFLTHTTHGIVDNGSLTLGELPTSDREMSSCISKLTDEFHRLRVDINTHVFDGTLKTAPVRAALQKRADLLKKEINTIKSKFVFTGRPNYLWFKWAILLRLVRRVLMKLHCANRNPDHPKSDHKDLFTSWLIYYKNFHRNLLKKIVWEITKTARDHHVHTVVLEDLLYFRHSLMRERNDNDLLTLWSPRDIRAALETSLLTHGIALAEVDPRHTSQLDPETGEFGYRDKPWRRGDLWVRRPEGLVKLDCDLAAAKNIAQRFLTQHRHLSYVKAAELPDGRILPIAPDYKEIGPRLQGALLTLVGGPFAVFVPKEHIEENSDGCEVYYEMIPHKISQHDYRQLLKTANQVNANIVELFKHGTSFYRREKHKQFIDLIASEVKGCGNDQAPSAQPPVQKGIRVGT